MEKNYITEYQETCFYVSMPDKQYGVYINIKDIDKADEIIKGIYNDEKTKRTIEALKKEWEGCVV